VVPVKFYCNAYSDQKEILLDNQRKAGVYRWINLTHNKSYIGSSVDLGRKRLLWNFFSKKRANKG
jgi:hypothetical protein